MKSAFMPARFEAYLGGRGTVTIAKSKHHTLRVVTIPPPSQSGGFATALQSASHEINANFLATSKDDRFRNRLPEMKGAFMPAQLEAYLGGRGTVTIAKTSKHHTLRVVTIPPPSQSGGFATALQSASHEINANFLATSQDDRFRNRLPEMNGAFMPARFEAYFAKLWSAVAAEPPLWEGGGRRSSRRRSKHHTLRVVTIPPPSQSGGFATALQSASHEINANFLATSQDDRFRNRFPR